MRFEVALLFEEDEEKKERLSATQEYETPGYLPDDEYGDDLKEEINGNMELLTQIKELQKQIMTLEMKMKEMERLKDDICYDGNMSFNRNCNDNDNTKDHSGIFEKWYIKYVQLPQYYDCLVEAGYDSKIGISDITDSDLQELGITKKGHRVKILKVIKQFL